MDSSYEIKVSIIVPIYNATQYLEQCVRSLMMQTYHNIEYLFIDDASNDGSVDMLRTLIDEYPSRIAQCKIYENDINKGVAFCRHVCMKNATGEFLIHVDSDDYVDLWFIEKMLVKERIKSYVFVCHNVELFTIQCLHFNVFQFVRNHAW